MSYENEAEGDLSSFEQAKKGARERYQSMELLELVQAMDAVRKKKDEADEVLSRLNAEYDVLRIEVIPEKMESMGIERVSYEAIGRVSLTADLQVSVRDKPGMIAWLDANKLGDIVQPTINNSTLKAFVKGRMKKDLPLPEEMLNITPFTRASITKK